MGGRLEGMINLPIGDSIAFRAVAFYQRDAGYIDNIFGSADYCGDPIIEDDEIVRCVRNGDHASTTARSSRRTSTTTQIYGGRAALKIDLNENWTVTPTIMHQKLKANGVFFMDAELAT